MKSHLSVILLLLLFSLSGVACNSQSVETVDGTETPKPCAVTPSFARVTEAQPTTVLGAIAQSGEIAPSYEQISAKLKQFSATADDNNYSAVLSETNSFLRQALFLKRVSGWRGWVVSTGVEALRSLQVGGRFGGYAIDDDPYFKSGAILVSMVDPFAITSTEGMTATWTSALSAHPYVALREAKEESGQPLCIGQLVSFDGYIADSPEIIYDRSDIVVSGAAVRVVSNPIPDRTVGSDLKDFVVKMHRIGGWASPRYQVILFGDGTVVFEDKGGSIDGGFRIATISEESVRQLRGKFVEADFFSMSDYDEYAMTDAAYTRVTLNMDGKRKSVLHYYGNTLPAEKITGLEKSIYQIIEPFKWVEGDY